MYLFCGQKTSRKQVNIFKKIRDYFELLSIVIINCY